MKIEERVMRTFRERFGEEARWLVRAPGRVNLIGEHTDYNDGFVLPMAIDRAVWIAARPRMDGQVRLYSLDFEEEIVLDTALLQAGGESWGAYVTAMGGVLSGAGYEVVGWEGVMAGDVPIGAGLSSSAALELGVARVWSVAGGWDWDGSRMAQLAQKGENEWVGVQCGIMDQMISAMGKEGQALLLDCRSLEVDWVPLPAGTAVVVLDTGTRRGLVDSAYNERRQQCEAAARFFGVKALRDVSLAEFERREMMLEKTMGKRARHVISENERTLAAAVAMRAGDAERLGELMNASHESLRDDFEVSSRALDVMVNCAWEAGCYGARMTGAGFGGCAMALVAAEGVDEWVKRVAAAYEEQTGNEAQVYVCQPMAGAGVEAETI
ncbi:MAG TPA: galactokinase [Anaerolineae bacterium]|nr:galactokinase [Anaerolineae bacterium]